MNPDQVKRKIIHIDMDAFYAAVEQRDRPELKGKAVIVGGSPNGRGVVATASYEARKYGVHSAMPSSQAARLCPQGIFVKPRFDVYKDISKTIREIFYDYTELVEPLSLDEAYLDVTQNLKKNPSATLIAKEIKQRIYNEVQITASAGVSYNKFLAKIASDFDKPNGLTLIPPEKAEAFLAELDIKRFHGVGKATQKKMHAVGIKNGADLKLWSEMDLIKAFGKSGRYYYHIVRGIDHRQVKSHRIRKSYGKERTFQDDIDDPEWLQTFLDELAKQIADGLQKISTKGRTITLKVRYDDFKTITRSISLPVYTNLHPDISEAASQLLAETEVGFRKIRLLGISLSNLNTAEKSTSEQIELVFKSSNDLTSSGAID